MTIRQELICFSFFSGGEVSQILQRLLTELLRNATRYAVLLKSLSNVPKQHLPKVGLALAAHRDYQIRASALLMSPKIFEDSLLSSYCKLNLVQNSLNLWALSLLMKVVGQHQSEMGLAFPVVLDNQMDIGLRRAVKAAPDALETPTVEDFCALAA